MSDRSIPPLLNDELGPFFEKVQDSRNWKFAIAAFVSAEDLGQTIRAIEYFTGGKSTVNWDGGREAFYITSPGYYNVIGA